MLKKVSILLLLCLAALPAMAQRPLTIVGGVVTANVADTNDFQVALTANVTGVTLVSTTGSANTPVTPATGYQITMRFVQDATGSRTVVFGGNISTTCTVNATANAVTICRWQYTALTNAWADAGGGGITTTASIPGTPGLTAVPVTSGLMAEYRMLPSESPCAILDYSGNGNNATGCVGTSPTINAVTGGLHMSAGAVSLPAALNSAQTVQIFIGNANGNTNGALLAGNGVTTSSSIFSLTVFSNASATQAVPSQAFTAGSRIFSGWMEGGNNFTFFPRAVVEGNIDVAWVQICDSSHANFDTIYVNGADQGNTTVSANNFIAQRCSQGHQTTGNFQLGGIASASCVNWTGCNYMNSGNIYYAVFYNRPLNAAEVAQNSAYFKSAMNARAITPTIFQGVPGTFNPNPVLAIDGDSLSCGPCASSSPNPVSPYSSYLTLTAASGGTWAITNQARVGIRLDVVMQPYAAQAIDPIYRPDSPSNTVVIWGGTNDGSASASTVTQLASYCQARHAVGWKCLPITMISRNGLDSNKNAYNTAIRQLWPTFADGLIDLGSDVNIGADGANASTTYFAGDRTHVLDVGVINDETPWIQRAVNRLYGNRDFSTATVYAAAATAAVATTAGSEATNTVTLTFGATPANCLVGNMITVAGTTPAGYSGNWLIRTRSATQVTYFAATAGMGAISVQGTGVCPQQQDADQYQVLNFGAGNFTLQSCVGYTGQNIYLRNINAAATTLVPFGSETITGGGATPTSIAAATTAILQSQLVSSAAGGCNWVRLQ